MRRWRRALPLLLGLSMVTGTVPAQAVSGHHTATHVVAHVSPSTVRTSSPLLVTGSVAPAVAGSKVVLQRLVAKKWRTLATRTIPKTGLFSFTVKASRTAGPWTLRVSRAASKSVAAGESHHLAVRVTRPSYAVTATAAVPTTTGGPVVVTGSVHPAAAGKVAVQLLVGSTWKPLGTATLHASRFSFSAVLSPGSHQLRVLKAFSATVAAGTSASSTVVVPPPPVVIGPPAVTTTTFTPATVGVAYSLSLTASGGVGPYSWSAQGLPGGLALSTAGVVSGTSVRVGTASVVVTVTDSRGMAAGATLSLQTLARPGVAWGWGSNGGKLGDGTSSATDPTPAAVVGLTHVTQLAVSAYSGFALDADGTVRGWGLNLGGELGLGTMMSSNVPIHIPGLTGIVGIAAGRYDSYFLKADGTVWSAGVNTAGQLGDGGTTASSSLVPVTGLTAVVALAAADSTGYALRGDGTVWAWGASPHGELGNNGTTNSSLAAQVPGLSGVTAIAGGSLSGYALKADGTVWSWGYNAYGQLGDTSMTNSGMPVQVAGLSAVTTIAGGQYAGYALKSDGTVWSWGINTHGELGINSTTNSATAVKVLGLTGVTAISAGYDAAYAVLPGGYVASWGRDDESQLGNASTLDSLVPSLVIGISGAYAVVGGPASNTAYALVGG